MNFAGTTALAQRWLIVFMVAGSAVLAFPKTVEPFMLPKATLIVVSGVLIAALASGRWIWTRQFGVPASVVTAAAAVFALALLLSTVTSPLPLASSIGFYSRYTGLIPYLAYLIVFIAALRLAGPELLRLIGRAGVVSLLCVSAYGFLQSAGVDLLQYGYSEGADNFSLFGNVNFSGAWTGAVLAMCVPVAASRDEALPWRVAATFAAPVALLYVFTAGSAQGVVAAAIGLTWALLVVGLGPGGGLHKLRARNPRALLAGAVVTGVLLVVGATVAAPRVVAEVDQSLVERRQFWAAGLEMFGDRPVLGTGLDTYAHHFLAYRSVEHAVTYGPTTTDAPHSVPLGMFTNGGFILGVSYLVFVGAVAWVLLTRVRRAEGAARASLAGFGGVWLAYQVQSAVSFDVPPLAVLHWVTAGLIVGVAAPPHWVLVRLPGRAAGAARSKRGKPVGPVIVPAGTWVALGAVLVGAAGAAWLALLPLRADIVAASAAGLTKTGQYGAAVERFERAAAQNPSEATYSFLAAKSYQAGGLPARAFKAAAEAAHRDPGTVEYPLFAARLARQVGDADAAERWFRRAAAVDPRDPPVLTEVAEFLLAAGDSQEAERLLSRSITYREDVVALVLLARARAAHGDEEGTRQAAERALALDPSNVAARQLLEDESAQPQT